MKAPRICRKAELCRSWYSLSKEPFPLPHQGWTPYSAMEETQGPLAWYIHHVRFIQTFTLL
jgi:hypothetical protein